MEGNSSGARSAPGAFGAIGTSDPHAILSSNLLYITHVSWLPAMLRPSVLRPKLTTRPPAAPAPPAPQPLFSACESVAVLRQAMRVCSLAAVLRPKHLWRRLRRLSARPSAALRCCRIRLHWPATTPRPRAIPPQRTGASNDAPGASPPRRDSPISMRRWRRRCLPADPPVATPPVQTFFPACGKRWSGSLSVLKT